MVNHGFQEPPYCTKLESRRHPTWEQKCPDLWNGHQHKLLDLRVVGVLSPNAVVLLCALKTVYILCIVFCRILVTSYACFQSQRILGFCRLRYMAWQ